MHKKVVTTILIIVVALVIITGSILVWQHKNLFPQEAFSCRIDTDCILAYTGMESCAPCDHSDNSFQCVSLEEAARLQRKRFDKHGAVACAPCQTPSVQYVCVCEKDICFKQKREPVTGN